MTIPNEVFGSFLTCLLGFVLMDGRDSAFDPLEFRVFKLEKLFNYHVMGRERSLVLAEFVATIAGLIGLVPEQCIKPLLFEFLVTAALRFAKECSLLLGQCLGVPRWSRHYYEVF